MNIRCGNSTYQVLCSGLGTPHEQDTVLPEPVSRVAKRSEGAKGSCDGDCVCLDTVVSEGLSEEVTLQLRPESERSQICADVEALPVRQRTAGAKALRCSVLVRLTVEAGVAGTEGEWLRSSTDKDDCAGPWATRGPQARFEQRAEVAGSGSIWG